MSNNNHQRITRRTIQKKIKKKTKKILKKWSRGGTYISKVIDFLCENGHAHKTVVNAILESSGSTSPCYSRLFKEDYEDIFICIDQVFSLTNNAKDYYTFLLNRK